MKELTIEEKARRYDEALKVASKYKDIHIMFSSIQDEMFPELAESDDERIRKALTKLVKKVGEGYENVIDGVSIENAIVWLEKQGGQKSNDKIQLGKKYKCIASPRYSTFMTGKIYKPEDKFLCKLMNFCYDCFEPIEDDEQKVEPKFKVGDWVMLDRPVLITKVENMPYNIHEYWTSDGTWFGDATKAKLWTIQDAKDGDVLYESSTNTILMFRSQTCGWIKVYCDLWTNKISLHDPDSTDYGRVSEMVLKPATKEQRDLLFQKMKEAGYEWDADKKELRKILQKPWSEEDEIRLTNIIIMLKEGASHHFIKDDITKAVNWLKSLRPQKWRPTEDQIMCLQDAISNYQHRGYKAETLESLCKQLKQL